MAREELAESGLDRSEVPIHQSTHLVMKGKACLQRHHNMTCSPCSHACNIGSVLGPVCRPLFEMALSRLSSNTNRHSFGKVSAHKLAFFHVRIRAAHRISCFMLMSKDGLVVPLGDLAACFRASRVYIMSWNSVVVSRIECIPQVFDIDTTAHCSRLQILSPQIQTPFLCLSYIDVH